MLTDSKIRHQLLVLTQEQLDAIRAWKFTKYKPHDFECLAQETGIQRDHKEHKKITKSYRITDTHYLAIFMIDVFSQFKTKKYYSKLTFSSFDIKFFFVRGCWVDIHTHKIDAGTKKMHILYINFYTITYKLVFCASWM